MAIGRLQERRFKDEEEEIALYKKLLRKKPGKYILLDFLANALFKIAEYEEAIHCWEKLLRKSDIKGKFRVYARIAQSYELLGEAEYAYYNYWKAMKENPTNLELVGKYGEMAYLIENYQDSLNSFKRICEKEPDNEIAWHNLGLSYYNLGFHDEAISALNVAIGLDPKSADSYYVQATIYAENYLFDDALLSLESAIMLGDHYQIQARNEPSFYGLSDLSLFVYMLQL
ncbi:MAG: tetratricopeptide repeat protein [Candidatus Heimdallarchaeota archaeon]